MDQLDQPLAPHTSSGGGIGKVGIGGGGVDVLAVGCVGLRALELMLGPVTCTSC